MAVLTRVREGILISGIFIDSLTSLQKHLDPVPGLASKVELQLVLSALLSQLVQYGKFKYPSPSESKHDTSNVISFSNITELLISPQESLS